MRVLFLYPPSPYLNHSMFKHYTYFAETIEVVSRTISNCRIMDCAVEIKSRNEIYDAFGCCDLLAIEIEPYNVSFALSLAEIFKDIQPQGVTMFFGTGAVLIPHFLSRQAPVDYIIANGNFAQGILDVANGTSVLTRGTQTILYPKTQDGKRSWGCSLDSNAPLDKYRYYNNNMFEFTVQVGCPFSCSFCSEQLLFPKDESFVYAQRPVEDVIHILKRVKDDFSSVYFSATTLTFDRMWIAEICHEMILTKCCIPWRSDTRVDYLDPELLQLMKESGLKQLSLGVESFEDHLLSSVNKCQKASTVYEQIVMCKEKGIDVKALLILGLPGQSADDVLHTQAIVEKLGISYRWKEYSPIRELYLADRSGEDISSLLDGFSRNSFRSDSIPGLSSDKYMSLLFPRGYVR